MQYNRHYYLDKNNVLRVVANIRCQNEKIRESLILTTRKEFTDDPVGILLREFFCHMHDRTDDTRSRHSGITVKQ